MSRLSALNLTVGVGTAAALYMVRLRRAAYSTLAQRVRPPVLEKRPKMVPFGAVAGQNRGSNPMQPILYLEDPYFYVRDDFRKNEEVLEHLRKENEYTDIKTKHLANVRTNIYNELLSHVQETDEDYPYPHGPYLYYNRTVKGSSYAYHCRKAKTPNAPEELMLDENEVAKGHNHCQNLPARGKMVKLVCAIVGVAGSAFPVDIDASQLVGDLKDAIKNKKKIDFKDIDADKLQLFLAKTERGAWLTEADVNDGVNDTNGLTPLDVAGAPLNLVGLSGTDVQFTPTIEDVKAKSTPVHVLVVVPDQQSVSAVATVSIKKRKLAEISDLITPSSLAKRKGSGSWVKWLKKLNGQIECHRVERSDDETPIPVVLLNKTFARFEENCKVIKFSQNDCEFVSKLCYGLSTPYDNEATFAEKARQLLTAYLLGDNPVSTITPATVNGSVSDGSYRFGETLLLNLECKLQKGDGGGDPTMQNVAYYIKNLPLVIDRQFPCFLVDICGPFMSVFGIVNTSDEDAICEPLVMSFPLLFFDNEWLMVSLARMCASLKTAVQELTNSCYDLSASRQNRAFGLRSTTLDRLRFPYKDSVERNGADISFQYLEVVQRFVFKAHHAGNNVIIKFAKRYGREVHDYCSSAGFAPELLFCEYLPNGWVFVVMEQLPLCPLRQANGMIVRDQLLKIENTLKDGSFVLGDLREHNVMWDTSKSRVVLIDFDWSGRDGVDTYPPFINGEIAWPPGAVCGEPLRVAHDAYWIASIAARLT